ncbi:uncharacterized protein [Ambystoma mexicanum]|uniref:uncharacterized protein n=1 Tax=Ambystoma mexicanum TaxID=8296 RepID=UPI0037E9B0CA
MVGNHTRFGTLQGVVYRFCMLCTILASSNCHPCQGDKQYTLNKNQHKEQLTEPKDQHLFKLYISKQSNMKKTKSMVREMKGLFKSEVDRMKILNQIKAKATSMEPVIEDLFKFYIDEQELKSLQFLCDELVKWFPKENIPRLPETAMLQEIYRTLVTMDYAITMIIGVQNALNPNSSLISRLISVESSTVGLQFNIYSALFLQHVVPTHVTPADIPTPYNIFEAKVSGCRVLKSYMKFIKEIVAGLKRITKRRCRKHEKEERINNF